MTWTPTEGQKRADALMREMFESAQSLGIPVATGEFPMHHHRVFTLIAAAIDQALTDGAAQEALALATLDGAIGNGHDADALDQLSGLEGWRDMPAATADPVGFPPIHFEPMPPIDMPGRDIAKLVDPPKKRGRPKGSKGKAPKAKKAKAPKAAKAERVALYPVDDEPTPVEVAVNGTGEQPVEAPPA